MLPSTELKAIHVESPSIQPAPYLLPSSPPAARCECLHKLRGREGPAPSQARLTCLLSGQLPIRKGHCSFIGALHFVQDTCGYQYERRREKQWKREREREHLSLREIRFHGQIIVNKSGIIVRQRLILSRSVSLKRLRCWRKECRRFKRGN